MLFEDAGVALASSGFVTDWDKVTYPYALGLVVIGSSPASGKAAPKGSSVRLTFEAPAPATTTAELDLIEPVMLDGSGDDVLSVGPISAAAVLEFACSGCDGNTVLKTDGYESLLVNTIGDYSGTHLINLRDGYATSELEISATGTWSVKIYDLALVVPTQGPASGTGDAVVLMQADGTKAAVTCECDGNFVVNYYGSNDSGLAVNEIGIYSGTVKIDFPAYIQVNADGPWAITPA